MTVGYHKRVWKPGFCFFLLYVIYDFPCLKSLHDMLVTAEVLGFCVLLTNFLTHTQKKNPNSKPKKPQHYLSVNLLGRAGVGKKMVTKTCIIPCIIPYFSVLDFCFFFLELFWLLGKAVCVINHSWSFSGRLLEKLWQWFTAKFTADFCLV